jgi:hypothetical protein
MIESLEMIIAGYLSFYFMPVVFALFVIGYLTRLFK